MRPRNDIWVLFLPDDGIPRLFPRLNTAQECPGVLVTHFNVFDCLTGSARLLGSGAIEDNFLVLGQGGKSGFEFIEGDAPFQLHPLELRIILVGANQ